MAEINQVFYAYSILPSTHLECHLYPVSKVFDRKGKYLTTYIFNSVCTNMLHAEKIDYAHSLTVCVLILLHAEKIDYQHIFTVCVLILLHVEEV